MPHRETTESPIIQESFRALAELAPDFVVLLGAEGTINYVSPAVTRVLGYDVDEVLRRPFPDFVHPDNRMEAQNALADLPIDEMFTARLRIRRKDGGWSVLETFARNYALIPSLRGTLVSTRDVTRYVEFEQRFRASLDENQDLYNNAPCGYHSLDADGVITRINDTELRWLGYTREELVGTNVRNLLTPESQVLFDRQFPLLKADGPMANQEVELVRRDGTRLSVLLSATAVTDAEGRFVASRATLFDMSERKHADAALRRVNRALLVLSSVNQELIHAESEPELLDSLCRLIVELGGYRLAWVGYAERDEERSVRPMAQAGFEQGYLESARITWADSERGRGPTGTAIRTGTCQVNQDFLSNSRMAPWREEALRRGYQSSIALPLKDSNTAFGALMIYASEPDAFDEDAVKLLTEAADDLAFGVLVLRTRAEHQRAREMVEHLAYYDPLTGLPNRNRLYVVLQEALSAGDTPNARLALLTMNVSGFSDIQSGIGVRESDELLKQVADRLQGALAEDELVARTGGDVFTALLPGAGPAGARRFANRVGQALDEPFQQAGIPINVRLNTGAALAPAHGKTADVLLVRSGIACRDARRSSTDYVEYSGTDESESPRHLALISELRAAIGSDQLVLDFQPKIDVRSGRVAGAEALVRWRHPQRGRLGPGDFIGLAEHTGLIKPLTYRILDLALRQVALWSERGFEIPVAVNVSVSNLVDPEFADRVLQTLAAHDVSPDLLQLEITETIFMQEPGRVEGLLKRLTEPGVSIYIDDFGKGYSSLSYIAALPIRALKIDQAFVSDLLQSPRVHAVVAATISLAGALGIRTVAEGVETKEQAQELINIGCDEIQGFFFARPAAPEEMQRWVDGFEFASYGFCPGPQDEQRDSP